MNIAQINHYFTKSREEFINRKTARGPCCLKETILNAEKTFNDFQITNNEVDDDIMKPFISKLK